MRFTKRQYAAAIQHLKDASEQLEPDGLCCACCGDSGHQAFECGFNPLVAMAMCKVIADGAREMHDELHASKRMNHKARLHELLHGLSGFDFHMGRQCGPAAIRVPEFAEDATPDPAGETTKGRR